MKSVRAKRVGESEIRLVDDVAFSRPSAAAVYLFGISRNGRTDWIVKEKGINYGAWKDILSSDQHPEEKV